MSLLKCSLLPTFAAVSLAFAAAVPAQDVLILKNGNRMEGRIARDKGPEIEFQIPGGKVLLPRTSIRSIDRSRPYKQFLTYGWTLLKKKDFHQAEEVYKDGLKAFIRDSQKQGPLLEGLLETGRGFLSKRHFEDCRRAMQFLLLYAPNHARGQQLLKDADRMCRKIQKEMSGYQHLLKENPGNDFARYQLGLRYESLGQPEEAKRQYLAIVHRYPQISEKQFEDRLDLLRGFIRKNLVIEEVVSGTTRSTPPDSAESEPFRKYRTARVTIFHHSAPLAIKIAGILDRLVPELENAFRIPPDSRPYLLYLYPNREEYVKATGKPSTLGYCEGARKLHLYQTAPRLLDALVPHELVHATLYRKYSHLPSWLDEGLAVSYESGAELRYPQVKRWTQQGQAFAFTDLIGRRVNGFIGQKRMIFYGQSYTLVDFLRHENGGQPRMRRFMDRLSRSPDLEQALRLVYGIPSVRALEKLWKRYMEL